MRTHNTRLWLVLSAMGCLALVALTHAAERTRVLADMGWGSPSGPGHYVELASATLGVALLSVALIWRRTSS